MPRPARIGSFPYRPDDNPYQRLFTEAIELSGLTVVRIPPRKLFPLHWAVSHPIDLLHIDWPHDFYAGRNWMTTQVKRIMFDLGCRRLRSVPVVWTAHNLLAHDTRSPAYERHMLQKLVDCCDGIVAMSNAAAESVRAAYRIPDSARVAVIPHGHYIDAYPNRIDTKAARQRLGISSDGKVVLFIGEIRPYKGVEELIRAFQTINSPDALLLIAGQPNAPAYGARLQELAGRQLEAGTIRFRLESVPSDELQVYFNACDVVALPFRRILNSGSLLLALSFGRCVVAPQIGSIGEVAPANALFGYDPSEAAGLERALRGSLGADDLIERGRAAREFVREHYGWDAVGRKLRELYTAILSTAEASP